MIIIIIYYANFSYIFIGIIKFAGNLMSYLLARGVRVNGPYTRTCAQ